MRLGISRRIGVDYAGEAAEWPLRFFDMNSYAVSGPASFAPGNSMHSHRVPIPLFEHNYTVDSPFLVERIVYLDTEETCAHPINLQLAWQHYPCAHFCALLTGKLKRKRNPPTLRRPSRCKWKWCRSPVVVTDQAGNHVRDLKKEDFQIFEDGVLQEIAGFAAVEEPISVALTLDTSGSTEFQLDRIRQEAMRFVKLLRDDDSIAIVSFADDVKLLEPFNIYHKKNPEVLRKLKPGGLSAVYEAVWLSLEQVLKLEYGRKALVLFSDGVDNRSETVTEEETLDLARKTESTVYCIYFNTNKDRFKRMPQIIDPAMESSGISFAAQWPPIKIPTGRGKNPEYAAGREYLSKLAQYSGGLLVDASRIENLGAAFGRIAQELRSQYSLGYYPKNYEARRDVSESRGKGKPSGHHRPHKAGVLLRKIVDSRSTQIIFCRPTDCRLAD